MVRKLVARSNLECDTWPCRAPLSLATSQGHVEAASELLSARANINAPNPDGRSPLQLASLAGHLGTVHLLLQRDALVNIAAPEDGRTALHRAASRDHLDVVEELLTNGADRFAVDSWNHTA